MRSSNVVVLCDSNSAARSYLTELRKIAVNFRLLSCTTSARLKGAAILLGSRCVRRRGSDWSTDHVEGDEADQDMEYNLLAPSQVAIADDVITYQQFGHAIFCAPQETILEGEYNSTCF